MNPIIRTGKYTDESGRQIEITEDDLQRLGAEAVGIVVKDAQGNVIGDVESTEVRDGKLLADIGLLFSQRAKVEDAARRWCRDNDLPENPHTTVAALEALGLLDREVCKAVEDPKGPSQETT